MKGEAEWALSLWALRDGRLWRGVETWAPEHAAPAWRAQWVEPMRPAAPRVQISGP